MYNEFQKEMQMHEWNKNKIFSTLEIQCYGKRSSLCLSTFFTHSQKINSYRTETQNRWILWASEPQEILQFTSFSRVVDLKINSLAEGTAIFREAWLNSLIFKDKFDELYLYIFWKSKAKIFFFFVKAPDSNYKRKNLKILRGLVVKMPVKTF